MPVALVSLKQTNRSITAHPCTAEGLTAELSFAMALSPLLSSFRLLENFWTFLRWAVRSLPPILAFCQPGTTHSMASVLKASRSRRAFPTLQPSTQGRARFLPGTQLRKSRDKQFPCFKLGLPSCLLPLQLLLPCGQLPAYKCVHGRS